MRPGKKSSSLKDEVADFELSDKTHLIIVKLPGNQIPYYRANVLHAVAGQTASNASITGTQTYTIV